MDVLGSTAPMFKGIVDEQLDIEEAEKVAQDLANDLGQTVTVDVTDENGEALDPLTFDRAAQSTRLKKSRPPPRRTSYLLGCSKERRRGCTI